MSTKKLDAVTKALGEPNQTIDLAEFCGSLINEFGGVNQLARDIRHEFSQAKPGSMMRVRIVELMAQVMKQVSVTQAGQGRPVSQMSDDDLRQMAASIMRKLDNAPKPGHPEGQEVRGQPVPSPAGDLARE